MSNQTDYRTMFDPSDYLAAFDLDGKDATVVIEKVERGEITSEGNKKNKKPILFFKGAKKRLAVNKTNGKIISAMYGKYVESWVGKAITLFPTTTRFGGEVKDCIRVRPEVPK